MKTKLYLDTRGLPSDRPAPLRYGISRNYQTAYLTLDVRILPQYWDSTTGRLNQVRWAKRQITQTYIDSVVLRLESTLLRLEADGALHGLSALEVRDILQQELSPKPVIAPTLQSVFDAYISRCRSPHTRELYAAVANSVDRTMGSVAVNKVTAEWLERYDGEIKRQGISVNSRSSYLAHIRCVLNYAARVLHLPVSPTYADYSVSREPTRKRSLTAEELREFLALPCNARQQVARDMFLLSFLLIGINHADLYSLRHSDYSQGRLRYCRAKTGTQYDIAVQPEAADLITRYLGKSSLLRLADDYPNEASCRMMITRELDGLRKGLTWYWARHSWATIAYNDLELPVDTISAALGHQYGSRITSVYINPDTRKVDEANRRMIDWVLYGTR